MSTKKDKEPAGNTAAKQAEKEVPGKSAQEAAENLDSENLDPEKEDPEKMDPKQQDPKKVDPKKEDPEKMDPKQQDPKKVDPKKVDPKPNKAIVEQAKRELDIMEKMKVDSLFKNTRGEYFTTENLATLSENSDKKKVSEIQKKVLELIVNA